MTSRNLPADMYRLIAQHANLPTLRALRGTSTQARAGAANRHSNFAKVATAYRSATSQTISPLVAALKLAARTKNYHKTIKVGKYKVEVNSSTVGWALYGLPQKYPVGSIESVDIWWERKARQGDTRNNIFHGTVSEDVGDYHIPTRKVSTPTSAQIQKMGPGAPTVVRLVKAALKEAFGA